VDPERGWRRIRTRENIVPGLPALYIYYSIEDDNNCALESVEVVRTRPTVQGFFDT
jgi:hypothetical protein